MTFKKTADVDGGQRCSDSVKTTDAWKNGLTKVGGLPYSERLRTPDLSTSNAEELRGNIKEYFNQAFTATEDLFTVLANDAAFYVRPDPLRHPLIFYYGHTASFYINKMVAAKICSTRVNPQIEATCAVGVDEQSWDDLDEQNYKWPTVKEVIEYRKSVREVVNGVIDNFPMRVPVCWEDPMWIIVMGIEHELTHMDTSSVLIRQLPLECVGSRPNWPICPESGNAPQNKLLPVAAGATTIGRASKTFYGWDNEFGTCTEHVAAFSAAKYVVTNREFLEFVDSQKYKAKEWWTDEGWQWLQFQGSSMPRFWRKSGSKYQLRCMTEVIDMPWNWPVEVNYFEAKAFCNWLASKLKQPIRLPTEAEWLHLQTTEFPSPSYPSWETAPANTDLAYWASSCPVTKFQHGRFFDLIGNVWQWTETPIAALPGFQAHPAYEDFAIPSFAGTHNIMKGGCWISTGNETLLASRYAFRRHFYQHVGFRYILSDNAPKLPNKLDTAYCETDYLTTQYLEFHYGDPSLNSDNLVSTIVKFALEALGSDHPKRRALDLGCAVGRACFELARDFDEVIGFDSSARFIRAAGGLQEAGKLNWEFVKEDDLVTYHEVTLEQLNLNQGLVNKVKFTQGDACNLKDNLKDFDLIIAFNLIERLYDPLKFLETIQEKVSPGGILAICSPYTWLEEHIEKSRSLNSPVIGELKGQNSEDKTTLQRWKSVLSPKFHLVEEPRDVEFAIKESRKSDYHHTFATLTLWRKN